MRLPTTLTVKQALQIGEDHLQATSTSSTLDARILLATVLQQESSYLYAWPERLLTDAEAKHYYDLLQQRSQGSPIAYLTRKKAFWAHTFTVTQHTLVPRPETELLVELALAFNLPPNSQLLDLGTGSGNIALSIAANRPDCWVDAVDATPETLMTAYENAIALGINNVNFLLSDWFTALDPQQRQYALIVSNPPYIASGDPCLLTPELTYEPPQALIAADNGLRDLQTIIAQAPTYLLPGGYLLLEHGATQDLAVTAACVRAGFIEIQTALDLAGHPRATVARKSP